MVPTQKWVAGRTIWGSTVPFIALISPKGGENVRARSCHRRWLGYIKATPFHITEISHLDLISQEGFS